jgi:hypothetical protein
MVSRLHWFAASLRPVELLAPLYGSDQEFPQPTGTFTPELPTSRSPFSSSGITTVAIERFHRWDFHPLESQLASLHRLLHPLLHAGSSRRTNIPITLKMPGTGILRVITDFVNKSLQSFGHITKLPRRPLLQVTVSSEPQYLLQCRCFSPLEGMVRGEW